MTAVSYTAALILSMFWAFALSLPAQAAKTPGVALVIGNAQYEHAGELANPKNDAEDVATALQAVGYRVIKGFDLDKRAMERTISRFARALSGAKTGVLFYAGHGIQFDGKNYLVPVDARLEDATGIDFELVQLASVQRAMERSVKTNVIFLDACRNNPLARNLARAMGTRSTKIVRGLASAEAGVGTLISFSTQPGNVALDGTGRNSPYSGALARHIVATQSDLSEVLINVRRDVMAATNNRQVPWEHSALTDRFYFIPAVGTAKAPPRPAPDFELQAEIAFWTAVRDTNKIALLQSYLDRYSDGKFADIARQTIAVLKQKQAALSKKAALAASSALPADSAALATALQRELKRVGCYPGAVDGSWGRGSKQAMTSFNASANMAFQTEKPTQAAILAIRKVFKRMCPELVEKTTDHLSAGRRSSSSRSTPSASSSRSAIKARLNRSKARGGLCRDGNMEACRLACQLGNNLACQRLN